MKYLNKTFSISMFEPQYLQQFKKTTLPWPNDHRRSRPHEYLNGGHSKDECDAGAARLRLMVHDEKGGLMSLSRKQPKLPPMEQNAGFEPMNNDKSPPDNYQTGLLNAALAVLVLWDHGLIRVGGMPWQTAQASEALAQLRAALDIIQVIEWNRPKPRL